MNVIITSCVASIDMNGGASIMWMGAGLQGRGEVGPGNWTTLETIVAPPNARSSFVTPSIAGDWRP